jgi:hypothetical protein
MRSFEDIRSLFYDQRSEENSKLSVKVREAQETKDTLLQRVGIKDQPRSLDDIAKLWDEADYRRRVREMVFEVPDGELRNQIMRALNRDRYEQYERWEMLSLFDEQFADRLRRERCRPPRPVLLSGAITLYVALLGIAYWFQGALDALAMGIILFPLNLVFPTISYITELYQHDVTLREAIKLVDRKVPKHRRKRSAGSTFPIFSRSGK